MVGKNRATSLAYEQQAIGRVMRRGQNALKVHCYRFYVKDTVEERLHELHCRYLEKQAEKEREAAGGGADGGDGNGNVNSALGDAAHQNHDDPMDVDED